MAGEVDPVSLEGRLTKIQEHLKNIDDHLGRLNSRTSKAEQRLDALEDRNHYRDGFVAGQGALSWRDALKIVGPLAALMGLALTALEVLG